MKKYAEELKISEAQVSLPDFMKSYNENIPQGFPHATTPLLKKFKDLHATLFKHGDMWSLDQHRKKLMDWLPRNSDTSGQATK
jgi:hypothetical protein